MPTENLLLTIPEALSDAALLERLAASGYHVTPGGRETLAIIYADTQGGALHRAGVRLRHVRPRPRWQWWKGGEILHEEPGTPEQVPLPPAGKIAAGGTVAPARLLPLVRIEIQKRNFRVTAPSGGPVRLSVLQLRCARPHRPDWAPGPRLVQIPPAGTASRPVEHLRAVLCHWVGLSSVPPDLLEIALESLGLPLPGAPVPAHLQLSGEELLPEACRKILGRQTFKIRANVEGAILDLDPEFVHDLRVATRRARFALRLFRDIVGLEEARVLREELRWLTGACAPVRDLDVLTAALGHQPVLNEAPAGMAGLLGLLAPLRDQARAVMIQVLQSERFDRLLQSVEDSTGAGAAVEPPAGAPVSRIAPRWIRRSLKRVRREGRSVGSTEPNSEQLHRLRIAFKGFRYTCEYFRELLPKEELGPLLDILVGYQDCLGRFQDAQVALGQLDGIVQARWQTAPRDPDEILTLGAAMHVFREQAARSRAEFLSRWPTFDRDVRDFRTVLRAMETETAPSGESNSEPGDGAAD